MDPGQTGKAEPRDSDRFPFCYPSLCPDRIRTRRGRKSRTRSAHTIHGRETKPGPRSGSPVRIPRYRDYRHRIRSGSARGSRRQTGIPAAMTATRTSCCRSRSFDHRRRSSWSSGSDPVHQDGRLIDVTVAGCAPDPPEDPTVRPASPRPWQPPGRHAAGLDNHQNQ